ncbi:ubiquinol oxidase subunit II [Sphingomonas jaspsi]|uniref:ubiquinol oxidase subunit II n=1 Tax=Sphingomonas jaspsi TaxID=392409 RepID=UPI001FE055A6|nr:ubiquinol oxidase subunit II [Sphingomonas jaspsi]
MGAPLLAALALAACSRDVFNPAGDIALQQRDLIYISVVMMLLIIVPVMIMIIWFSWRYRKGGGATYDPKFDHSTSLELVIWSMPLLIIIALGAVTWSSTHLLDPFRPLDRQSERGRKVVSNLPPLKVQVVSMDWKWLFIYPDQKVATVNELVVPVDREVKFFITSSNMMNAFYVPTMAGMIYAMPGMQSQMHAVINRPGSWQGMSANYSGEGFSDMRFAVRAVSEAEFATWASALKAEPKALDNATYAKLELPSQKVPVIRFASVDGDLYRRILERCVKPGSVCMTDMSGHHPAPATTSSDKATGNVGSPEPMAHHP